MTTPTVLEAQAMQLRDRLGDHGREVPAHLLLRLALLLAGERVEHAVADRQYLDRGDWSGSLLLLTDALVVLVTATSSVDEPAPHHEPSVDVQLWARATLQAVRLLDAEQGVDYGWHRIERDGPRWPRGTTVELTYRDRPEPLLLPLGKRPAGDDLTVVLPALLRDIAN